MEKVVLEEWRDIKGYEGKYQISNLGRVKTLPRVVYCAVSRNTKTRVLKEIIHKQCDNGWGYKMVSFRVDGGKPKTKYIHKMVAECFLTRKEGDTQVNHIDGNKANNKAENIEWCTASQNLQHSFDIGLRSSRKGEAVPQSKLTESNVLFIRSEYSKGNITQDALAALFGVNPGTIGRVINKKRWKHI